MLNRLGNGAQSLLVLLGLAVVLAIASPHFVGPDNLLNIIQQSAVNALLGIGLTFVIISGGIDLSVGSVLALCGLVVADLLVRGVPVALAGAAGLGVGAACGAINGLVTVLGRIPPFITTLGMMLVARSAAKVYSGSQPISGLPPPFGALAGDVGGVPVAALVVAVVVVGAHLVLTRTKLGRYAQAIGGNEQAAWLSGVPVSRYKVAIYAVAGMLAGLASLLIVARLDAASPLAGEMYELYAIAAAVIGGVSLMGGEGHVAGTLIGALIMGTLRNGLNLLDVPAAWEGVVIGTVLVAAVVVDRTRHRRRSAAASVGGRRRSWGPRALGAALFIVVCAGAFALRPDGEQQRAQLTFAFIPKSIGDPFWVRMKRAAEREAARHGVELVTLAPARETDVEHQFQVVENVVEQRVDAILLAPAGSKEIVRAIRKANDARIPVLVLDSDIDRAAAKKLGAHTETYIGSDNARGGRIAGRYLSRVLGGRGRVAILEGNKGHESTDRRVAGFRSALARAPALRVVAAQTANAERARGYTVAQNILQAHPQLDAIFGANDQMALGALEAVAAAGRLDKVKVVGFDGSAGALENIRAGRMLGSVAQFPEEMGRLGVLHAIRLVRNGQRPPKRIHTKVEMIDARALRRSSGQRAR